MKEKRYMTIFKSLLLAAASFAFLSCSNLFGGVSSESSSSEKKSSDKAQTITITGSISISDELKESGALPAEYLFLFNQINDSNERSAFPTIPSTGYYVTATDENNNTVPENDITITTNSEGTKFTIKIPINDTPTTWTIEAGLNNSFNNSTVTILKDTFSKSFSNTDPSFSHDFKIRPLTEGSGNIDLTINYDISDANKPDSIELYFGEDKITADEGEGETISVPTSNSTTSKITLKNRATGTYKARLVFKKNGYVVFTDYQGITVFPNMTTNTWVNSKSSIIVPINGSTYTLTDTLVQDYLLTQIYVGSVTIGTTTISGNDTSGNGTVLAPYATFAKAISFLQENGNSFKDYTIWICGEISGAQTISDGTESSPTRVKASSLTISGVTGNTSDSLKGSSGSVLLVDTSISITITNLLITGGTGTNTAIRTSVTKPSGGGINIKKGTVTLDTGAQITGNHADYGGGVYVASGATLFMKGNSLVGDAITNSTTTATATNDCANYATAYGGGIYVNGGELYIGYSNASTVDADFTGGVNRNACPTNTIPQDAWGGGIYYKGPCFKMAKGTVSYNYAKMSGGGITINEENTVFDFSGGSIEKNTAGRNGGGLYLNSAKVYMNGTAIIGDTGTTMTQATDFSNKVTSTDAFGGGFYMEGTSAKLYLGYKTPATEGGDPVADDSFTGGICHNYSAKYAGGLSHNGNQVSINKGNISYNKAEASGGGAYLSGSLTMTGGNFTSNTCGSDGNGGALYCSAGTFNLSGGTFTSNTCGSNGNGGAVYYSYGIFNYSGSLSFPSGSSKNNDIYITNSKKITIAGTSLSGSAKITPSAWTRGTQIIDGGTNVTDTTLSQFSLTDSDWSIEKSGSNSSPIGIINADIYVSASGNDSNSGVSSSKAFKTIAAAAKACKSCKTEIKVVGTFTASSASDLQSIPNSDDITVSSITLTGTGSGATINANSKGSALTINKAILVTIENITIKGGNTTNGAGLNVAVSGAKVNLGNNVFIKENKASGNGGGVYVASGAKLCLNGSAVIGNSGGNLPANTSVEPSSSNGINKANLGGGIYCEGTLGIGKSVNSSGNLSNSGFTGGIYTNVSTEYGGGIYLTSSSTLSTNGNFNIVNNRAGSGGGGIYYASTGALSLSSGTFTSNVAGAGGAILIPDGNNIAITLSGGSYTSNSTTTGAGGAINSWSTGLLKLEGSVSFSDNTGSTSSGGGALSHNGNYEFKSTDIHILYGGSIGSNDVWLYPGKYIKLEAGLYYHDSENPIGINATTVDTQVLCGSYLSSSMIEKFVISNGDYFIDSNGYMREDTITQADIEEHESEMIQNGPDDSAQIFLDTFTDTPIYFKLYTEDDDTYGVLTFTSVNVSNLTIGYEFKRFKNNNCEIDISGTINLNEYEAFPDETFYIGLNKTFMPSGTTSLYTSCMEDSSGGELSIDYDGTNLKLSIHLDGTTGYVGFCY